MFQSLANRDDSNLIIALRVRQRYNETFKKSKSDVARLTIVRARVLDGNQRAVKDCGGIAKVEAMFGEIELSLLFVPREHAAGVATLCRYVKSDLSARLAPKMDQ
jgi:hypothetical protein